MATEYVYFKGKTKWFRWTSPDSTFDPPRWKHVLYLDEPSLAKFRELQKEGVKNHLKKDDDGYYINITRPTYKEFKGKKEVMKPPVVLNDKNEPLSENISVGNGSDVTTKVEVYSYTVSRTKEKAKAMRWFSSRIDSLIPFNKGTDFTPAEEELVSGLPEQPAPLF